MSKLSIAICAGALTIFLSTATQSQPAQKLTDKVKIAADTALLVDPERAGQEFEKRLMQTVSVQDGLVLIRDPNIEKWFLTILPVNAPWSMTCGITGISIIFGTSVSGDSSSVGNNDEVELTRAKIDQKQCAVLGPRLGKRLLVLLQSGK